MGIRIRAATASDVPAMHQIRVSVRQNRLVDRTRVTAASYLPYVAAGSAWVAESSTGISGFAVLDKEANSVWALFVDPEVEAHGIGRALHDEMIGWAQQHGIRQLSLSTSQGTRAERFYRAAGWLEAGFTAEREARFVKTFAD